MIPARQLFHDAFAGGAEFPRFVRLETVVEHRAVVYRNGGHLKGIDHRVSPVGLAGICIYDAKAVYEWRSFEVRWVA